MYSGETFHYGGAGSSRQVKRENTAGPSNARPLSTDDLAEIRFHIHRLENRVRVLENGSQLFRPNASASESLTSSLQGGSMRSLSPGASINAEATPSVPGSHGQRTTSLGSVGGSSAAAAIAARYGKLTSIAQGRAPQSRGGPSGASSASTSTSASFSAGLLTAVDAPMPRTRPLTWKNGITLLKDRRLRMHKW
ncbi:hypothetical protein V8E36_007786 [Tilletia maclaganii]